MYRFKKQENPNSINPETFTPRHLINFWKLKVNISLKNSENWNLIYGKKKNWTALDFLKKISSMAFFFYICWNRIVHPEFYMKWMFPEKIMTFSKEGKLRYFISFRSTLKEQVDKALHISLEEGMATHSNILAWTIPWTEEPGRLQSMGLKRVGHNWAHTHTYKMMTRCECCGLQLQKHTEVFSCQWKAPADACQLYRVPGLPCTSAW